MTPPITIVERTTRVSVLGHLDELEDLGREFCVEVYGNSSDNLLKTLYLSEFIVWLRQRQRESVASDDQ